MYLESFPLFFFLGLLFLLSQIFGYLAKRYLRSPRLIGYLAAGILFGPSVGRLFSEDLVHNQLAFVTEIALGLVAFSIGSKLPLEELKKTGAEILKVTIFQAFGAFLIVFLVLLYLLPFFIRGFAPIDRPDHAVLAFALLLGAISVPTAPAATLVMVDEYRARGHFTSVLLGVVALDDMLALVFYAFAIEAAKTLIFESAGNFIAAVLVSLRSIALAVAIGGILGFLLKTMIDRFASREAMLGFILGGIFLAGGLAIQEDVSPLLANMVLGFVIGNYARHEKAEEGAQAIESISGPIYGIFFMIAGAHLDLSLLSSSFLLALILFLTRFAGKYLGAYLGARSAGSPPEVKRYLGMALLPAAGVTMGLTLNIDMIFSPLFPDLCKVMVSAIVGKVFINEVLAPFFVRRALLKTRQSPPGTF